MDAEALNLGMLILRVAVGLTFAAHGYGKFFTGGKIEGVGRWFDSMGMRPGKVHALLAASAEVGAGLFLALGFLTPLAALAMVGVMVVAGWTSHRDNGFFIIKEGWEYVFVLAIVAIAVATVGPGEISIDNAIGFDLNGWAGLAISAVGGVVAGVTQMALFYKPDKVPAAS